MNPRIPRYSIRQYGSMYTDKVRFNTFSAAMRSAITPNSVVLDIGTGTGIWAFLACSLGARHVYAIEPFDVIQLGREIAAANTYSDRITFLQDVSTNVELPERADIIISDVGGLLPFCANNIQTIVDARVRLLAPGGTLIPQQDRLRIGIIEALEQYNKMMLPWNENLFGLNLSAGWPLVANTPTELNDKEARLLTRPSDLAVLDYRSNVDSNLNSEVAWTIDQPGTAHGAAAWFDRTMAEGIEISNEPGIPEINTCHTYGQIFFPWPNPVELDPGDRVSVRLKANLIGGDYLWCWESTIRAAAKVKAHFRQSTMESHPISLKSLNRRESGYVPAHNEDVQIDAFVLSSIDGHASAEQIAHGLAASFPARFSSWQDALSRVGDVTAQYSAYN
jgi:type I protein arginine methyltransferase